MESQYGYEKNQYIWTEYDILSEYPFNSPSILSQTVVFAQLFLTCFNP